MENFTGLEVLRKEFALTEVVLKDGKNLAARFIIAKDIKGEIFEADGSLTYKHQSNEAFQSKLYELQTYLCGIKKVTEVAAKRTVHVKGLKLQGSGDSEGFIILGYQNSDKEGIMKCDSHKIHYEKGEYSWLEEVREIAIEIENKTFAYLFEGEKAVLSMGLGDTEDENDNITDTDHEDVTESEEQTEESQEQQTEEEE